MVWVIKSTEVPRKAKVNRKGQKESVPRMETEKIEMAIAWCWVKPFAQTKIPKLTDITIRRISFLSTDYPFREFLSGGA